MDGRIILVDFGEEMGNILDDASFSKHFEALYGGMSQQQMIQKSIEAFQRPSSLPSTKSIPLKTSSNSSKSAYSTANSMVKDSGTRHVRE